MLWCVAVQSVAQDADRNRRYDAFFLDAICQREKGNNDAVFDLLRHCVDIDSTRSEAYYYLAQYYSALKQKDTVLSYLKKSVELEPDNATYLETLANAYLNQRKYKDAIDVLERLCEKNHDRDDVLALLIQLYEQENDYDNAIRTLGRLETIEGKSERLSYAKSDLYTKKGDKKAAIAEMKQLADQYPNDNNYRCLYANTLYINGQKKRAVAIYDKVLKEEPQNRNAQMALLAYYNDQKDTLNVNLFHRLINMPQADSDMALFCASYMNMKKMPNDSIRQVLEKVLEMSPDHAAARLQLVSYAWQAEDRDRVIELCKAARQYNPDEMAFYYYQGIAYYQKDDLDNALNAFQNGIGVITSDSDPSIVSDFYAVMGDILHQKGMEKEAFEAYDSCLVWKEDNIGCLNNYAYYLSEKGIRLDDAEKMSFRTIKAEPKNATYLDTYAWILFMQKRYDEAKTYIDQTLENDTTPSAVLFEHAGDIYYHVGEKEKALEYWQEALEQSDESDGRQQILTRKIKLKKYLEE